MSRIIMLIPLDEDVGLTSISLGMIYFFNKNKFKKKSVQSMLYFSLVKKLFDDTSLIINKYFPEIVHTLDNINFSEVYFNSSEYFFLLNKIIDKFYNKKCLYDVILIEGINNNYGVNTEKINYDISQNLNAEVIFISNLENTSLECIRKKENKINLFLKENNYKNVLGVIFNKINSPFIKKKYDFIKKLTLLNKIEEKKQAIIPNEIFKNNFFPIIGCIPWNKKITTINVMDILNFLNVRYINLISKKTHIIKEIIIFDESILSILDKNYENSFIIVSFSRIDSFINLCNINVNSNKIRCIILTGTLKSKKILLLYVKV